MNVFLFLSVCFVLNHGVSGFYADKVFVFVMEGDSVTLNTDFTTSQHDEIWYFYKARLAQISVNLSKICTDDQCKDRFRDRLKVNHPTGSLTITNTRTNDSGIYKKINIGSGTTSEKTFNVTVYGVDKVEMKRESVKEGESVTLDSGRIKNPNDSLKWCFDKTLIAEITGDQSQICIGGHCNERFRDRLKVDHQTGSLTITNTRTTDSGEYQLLIFSFSSISVKSFSVDVTAAGPHWAVLVGCVAVALLILLVALLILLVALDVICKHQNTVITADTGEQAPSNEPALTAPLLAGNTEGASVTVTKSAVQNTEDKRINRINISTNHPSENQSDEENNFNNVSTVHTLKNDPDEETTHCQLGNSLDKPIDFSTVHQSENDGNQSENIKNKVTGGNQSENIKNTVTGGNQAENDGNEATGGNRSENGGNKVTGGNTATGGNQSENGGNKETGENKVTGGNTATGGNRSENGGNKATGENQSENGGNKATGENQSENGGNKETGENKVTLGNQSENSGSKVTGGNTATGGNKETGRNRSLSTKNKSTGGNRLGNTRNKTTVVEKRIWR